MSLKVKLSKNSDHRFGFVALVGPPNVGKSTLINKIIGEKISIISRRPQTTRHRILGIKSTENHQIVFVDTPGMHKDQRKNLNRVINRTAISSMSDVDLIVFMTDYKGWDEDLKTIFKPIKSLNCPVILLINKIDQLKDKSQLLPLIESSKSIHSFAEIIPLSALKLDNVDGFLDTISHHLEVGPPGFPSDQISDRSSRFMAAEFIREQVFNFLGQELPYSIATEITKFEVNDKGLLCIDGVIWVEKDGQKSIVIGKKGKQLKHIGTRARVEMEKSFNQKVFLTLWVKVRKGWAENAVLLRSLGYSES